MRLMGLRTGAGLLGFESDREFGLFEALLLACGIKGNVLNTVVVHVIACGSYTSRER